MNEELVDPNHPTLDLDEVIHQRARLGIMAIVAETAQADFTTIRSTLELTAGNLSQHLVVLEDAGYIKIRKEFEGKRPRTWVKITRTGRRAYREELASMKALIARFESDD